MALTEAGAMALSAAGSLGSNVSGGLFNINQAAKNRSFQERMFYKQLEENRKNWQMENEYNLPSAQRQRLEDAHLNPYLMYGEGAAGLTSQGSIGSPGLPSGSAAHAQFTNPVQDALQAKLAMAQAENIEANTEKTISETDWQEIENRFGRETFDLRRAILNHDDEKIQVEMQKMRTDLVNSSMITSQQVQSMIQGRLYEIKRFNLDYDSIGQQLAQGWKHLKNETEGVSQRWRELAIMWYDVKSQANLRNWQVGRIAFDIMWDNKMNPLKMKGLSLDNMLKRWDSHLKKADLNERQTRIVKNNLENWYYGRYGTTTPFEGKYLKDVISIGNMMDATFIVPWYGDNPTQTFIK